MEQTRPADELSRLAGRTDVFSEDFAYQMDKNDPLHGFRNKFCIPKMSNMPCVDKTLVDLKEDCIYLAGNSLGLKPKSADDHMSKCLDDWKNYGVLSHFSGHLPAARCDLPPLQSMARLIGAKPKEVAIMNGLTVNLHLLMVSFYQPTTTRHKILMEANAFPSDRYAIKSQIRFHGLDPENSLIQLTPREGEHYLQTQDILNIIEKEGYSIALIMFSGVQYYTGQKFAMKAITDAGHAKGCTVGFDLAHAVGNVKLQLNEWGIDFACWCSYKYLNSGAGGIAGAFIHEKHDAQKMPKLHGWWSNVEETRFEMKEDPDLENGVAALRISNPPPWLACLLMASLEIFDQTSMNELTAKQFLLTGYLELLVEHYFGNSSRCRVITPKDPAERGCQLSLLLAEGVDKIHEELEKRGVICDKRKPNVLRVAPIPLYNSYHDVYRFVEMLKQVLETAGSN